MTAPSYELMLNGTLTDGSPLEGHRATIMYKVTAAAGETILDQAVVRDNCPVVYGGPLPDNLGALPGAVCVRKRVVKIFSPKACLLQVVFSSLRWGAAATNILGLTITDNEIELPIWKGLFSTPGNTVYHQPGPPVFRIRPTIIYRENRVFTSTLTDVQVATIVANTGKVYTKAGLPMVFAGTSGQRSGNGQGRLVYVYKSNGPVRGSAGVANQLDIPDLGPLDEWDPQPAAVTPVINVKLAVNNYFAGAPLP